MIKVSDFVLKHLADNGVQNAFLVTGGGAMHLNDSLGRESRIRYVCNHHEQACAIAAEGYYRASGRLALVMVTSGPGGTNTVTGVIGQWLDSIPCLYVSGQVKQSTTIAACPALRLRQLGDQEINIVDIVRPVTKYAVMVRDPLEIRHHLEKAIYLATHGRPGPTWLDIPLDVQAAMVEERTLRGYDPADEEVRTGGNPLRKQVAELLRRIRQAHRPVVMAGHGIRLAGAQEEFLELAQRLGAPVLTSIGGSDLIWSDHRLFAGRPGICGSRLGNMVLQNSDLFLGIGTRLGLRHVSYNYENFARAAFRALVNVDEAELRKPTLRLHMAVRADPGEFIREMLRQLGRRPMPPRKDWLAWCRRTASRLPTIFDDNPGNPRYVNSYVFVDRLFRLLRRGDLVVTGNGTAYTGTYQMMHLKKGVRVFANQACASMGYDLPAAMGACFARGKRRVVLITGDGSMQMNIQELHTMVAHRLPIKIFVLNNQGYLAIRMTQDTYFNGRHVGSDPGSGLTCPDICKVAKAYGLSVVRIASERGLSGRIAQVLRTPGPVLCEIRMDPSQTLYPKLSSETKPDGTLVSKPLEDMFPFLPRETFGELMIVPPVE